MPTLLQCDNLLEPWRHLPREGCVAGVLVVPGESSAFFCLSELPFCVGAEFLIHHSLANSIVSSPTSWALARLVVPIMLSRESLPSVPDIYAVAVSGVPGDGSRVHTHDHGGSEAPDESPDSILSSEPKPLGKHRPPPPPCILSPRESSYPP
ncbi:hypothetical protein Tco_1344280 [Tanacetum coccineum]